MSDTTKVEAKHPFHLVNPSPWPLVLSMSVLVLAIGSILFMRQHGPLVMLAGLGLLLWTLFSWWHDVFQEGDLGDHHNAIVQRGLRMGMALFILSEVAFFAGFFWSYFHASLSPQPATGGVWPPKGVELIDPFHLPYLNTLLLLLSGTTITWAHHALFEGKNKEVIQGLALTVALGGIFSCVQVLEYVHAPFAFNSGIYASNFYMATGFHGFHVFVGTLFLAICLIRAIKNKHTVSHHLSFEAAAWYWHFVDVVWLLLFVCVYWWGYR